MRRVNIIGPGKLGRTFMALINATIRAELGDVFSANPATAEAAVGDLGAGRSVSTMANMRPADIWILSVPDDRIAQVAGALAQACPTQVATPIAMHCSGFLSSAVLEPLRDRGWSVASCHPVLSFGDPQMAARQFPGTCCAIEGDTPAAEQVADLITNLGGVPFPVDPARKPLYHAAAVFSNNFATVLQAIAREAWAEAGVAPEMAARLGDTLLAGTSDSVARLGPVAALTGPAARGDLEVLRQQEAAVAAWYPEAATLYATMSQMARRLKTDGATRPPTAAQAQGDAPMTE